MRMTMSCLFVYFYYKVNEVNSKANANVFKAQFISRASRAFDLVILLNMMIDNSCLVNIHARMTKTIHHPHYINNNIIQ